MKRSVTLGLLIIPAIFIFTGCQDKKSLSYSSIHEAAEKGDLQDVKRHLAQGTALNAKDADGLTPLHVAVINGRRDIVEFLIKKGADVNAIVPWIGPTLNLLKKQSYTPMTSQEYDDMVALLIKHGAKYNQ